MHFLLVMIIHLFIYLICIYNVESMNGDAKKLIASEVMLIILPSMIFSFSSYKYCTGAVIPSKS